jgi:hypothetical protein
MVIALAGVMIFPDLNPALRKTRDEAALRRTVATLDDLRRRAVSRGKTLTLSRGRTGGYLLLRVPGKDGDEELEEPLPEGVEAVSLEPEECRYFPQGHSSGLILTIRTGDGRLTRIEVGSFTGLARVADDG